MIDLGLCESDTEGSSDTDGLLSDGSDDYDSDCHSLDTGLSPIQKMEKYMASEHSYNRQMVVHGVIDTLQTVMELKQEVERVFHAVVLLSNDSDDTVRIEMVEYIPAIAEFCWRHERYFDSDVVSTHLLPIMLRYLCDSNCQARKAGQSSLVQLVSCKLISHDDIEKSVMPAIISMADPESVDDLRTDAVTLMSRLAPLVGRETTERLFLTRFALMCNDALFHVRKVCAANFGEICQVVGQQNTENCLLPKFYYLCEDGVWGVRNACAECFVQVSRVCSSKVRREELTPLFVSLLCDQSRWVRLAAFQALGGFISTFADSRLTGLELTVDGQVVFKPPGQQLTNPKDMDGGIELSPKTAVYFSTTQQEENRQLMVPAEKERCEVPLGDNTIAAENYYDSFHFWRVAPQLVDQSSIRAVVGNLELEKSAEMFRNLFVSDLSLGDMVRATVCATADETLSCRCGEKTSENAAQFHENVHCTHISEKDSPASSKFSQNIIPSELLSHYMGMIEPARAQTVDPEIMRHCAFSFPAVAFTLGRSNWDCIRDLYRTLAKDMQWKVRRTLAFSIHHLAAILGEDLTILELIPIFDEFIKDLDEVRIGILRHLADFLQVVHGAVRSSYLWKLPEFLKIDNSRNWRFRLELAEQLPLLVTLFTVDEICSHIRPIALVLSEDQVAAVRQSSLKAITSILKQIDSDSSLLCDFVEELKCRFGVHQKSTRRLMYLQLCYNIFEDRSADFDSVLRHLLPLALTMYSDPIPNIRIGLARLLHKQILGNAAWKEQIIIYQDIIQSAVSALQKDPDRDVLRTVAECGTL